MNLIDRIKSRNKIFQSRICDYLDNDIDKRLHNDKICPICGELMIYARDYGKKQHFPQSLIGNVWLCLGCGSLELE